MKQSQTRSKKQRQDLASDSFLYLLFFHQFQRRANSTLERFWIRCTFSHKRKEQVIMIMTLIVLFRSMTYTHSIYVIRVRPSLCQDHEMAVIPLIYILSYSHQWHQSFPHPRPSRGGGVPTASFPITKRVAG